MRTRESGMPPEEMWQTFFDPTSVLTRLGLAPECQHIVDFGCGYGTFAIPAAQMVKGLVDAFDIDSSMVSITKAKGETLGMSNLRVTIRDFVSVGSGLPDQSVDYVMLFNILHAAESKALLYETRRILKKDGKLAVMHWNYDPSTPRGPSMEIRPTPQRCMAMVDHAGFCVGPLVDLPPYHYGFSAVASLTTQTTTASH